MNLHNNLRIWSPKRVFQFSLVIFFFILSKGYCEEEFINLGTFLKERTQQYHLQNECKKIYLSTPPRTGSTLVYNILRFLFESEDHQPWGNHHSNLIIKNHDFNLIKSKATYVFTIRNPIDACLSYYLAFCSQEKKIIPLSMLNDIVQMQVNSIRFLEKLILKKAKVIVLRYEDFVNDFDYLFSAFENNFSISIDNEDKICLKKALCKENVMKNIAQLESFSQIDEFSLFHGDHISNTDFSEIFKKMIKKEITKRISHHLSLYEKWGYFFDIAH